jgi:hypothetical protein
MQKRRFPGCGAGIPRMAFPVTPGARFDRNLAAIGLVSMIARRSVQLLLIAKACRRAARWRPACMRFQFAPLVVDEVADAGLGVEVFDVGELSSLHNCPSPSLKREEVI